MSIADSRIPYYVCTSTYLRLKAACRLALAYKQTRRNLCFKIIYCTYQDHLFDESCLKAFELTVTVVDECTKFTVWGWGVVNNH
jgi:hypothetical protein